MGEIEVSVEGMVSDFGETMTENCHKKFTSALVSLEIRTVNSGKNILP